MGEPSASTQHRCRGSQWAWAQSWAAAIARHFTSQPGETSLHPVGGTCPLAAPPRWIIWGLFSFFCFWRRQREGAAVPSSLLNHACLGHRLAAASCDGELGLRVSQPCPQPCKHPNCSGGSTRSVGHFCYTPTSSPATKMEDCRRKGAASTTCPAFGHTPSPVPHIQAQFRTFSKQTSV